MVKAERIAFTLWKAFNDGGCGRWGVFHLTFVKTPQPASVGFLPKHLEPQRRGAGDGCWRVHMGRELSRKSGS